MTHKQVKIHRIEKPAAQIHWVQETIQQNSEQLQRVDIVIVLVGGPHYPYECSCSMNDAVTKEKTEHIEHVNRSISSKLTERGPDSQCFPVQDNLGQGT